MSNRMILSGFLAYFIKPFPVVEGDFSKISSSTDPIKVEAGQQLQLRLRLDNIEDQNTPEWKAQNPGKAAAMIFRSEVQEGDQAGKEFSDFVYLMSKEGKPIKRGFGRLKAYAEVIQGVEAANSPKGINTDSLPGGEYIGVFENESYTDNKVTPPVQKSVVRLTKLLPIG